MPVTCFLHDRSLRGSCQPCEWRLDHCLAQEYLERQALFEQRKAEVIQQNNRPRWPWGVVFFLLLFFFEDSSWVGFL